MIRNLGVNRVQDARGFVLWQVRSGHNIVLTMPQNASCRHTINSSNTWQPWRLAFSKSAKGKLSRHDSRLPKTRLGSALVNTQVTQQFGSHCQSVTLRQ